MSIWHHENEVRQGKLRAVVDKQYIITKGFLLFPLLFYGLLSYWLAVAYVASRLDV